MVAAIHGRTFVDRYFVLQKAWLPDADIDAVDAGEAAPAGPHASPAGQMEPPAETTAAAAAAGWGVVSEAALRSVQMMGALCVALLLPVLLLLGASGAEPFGNLEKTRQALEPRPHHPGPARQHLLCGEGNR